MTESIFAEKKKKEQKISFFDEKHLFLMKKRRNFGFLKKEKRERGILSLFCEKIIKKVLFYQKMLFSWRKTVFFEN